jgi:hypothetical protein
MGAVAALVMLSLFASPLAAEARTFPLLGVGPGVYRIAKTGHGTLIGQCATGALNSLADRNGVYYSAAVSNPADNLTDKLVTVDGVDGHCTVVHAITFASEQASIRGLAFAGAGLFAINNGGGPGSIDGIDGLYKINQTTGRARLIGTTGMTGIQGLEFAYQTMYGWDVNVGLVTIDRTTGVATDVNPSVGGSQDIQTLRQGPNGLLYGARDHLYKVDRVTGAITLVGSGDPDGYTDLRGIG